MVWNFCFIKKCIDNFYQIVRLIASFFFIKSCKWLPFFWSKRKKNEFYITLMIILSVCIILHDFVQFNVGIEYSLINNLILFTALLFMCIIQRMFEFHFEMLDENLSFHLGICFFHYWFCSVVVVIFFLCHFSQ